MNARMVKIFLFAAVNVAIAACGVNATRETIPGDWEQTSYIVRGEYLVNHLGDCIGCHTPRDANNQTDKSLFLSGVPAKYAGVKTALSPMEWSIYGNMKEEDARAIYRYLRTVKAISNKVPANIPPR